MSPGFVHPSLILIFGALLLPLLKGPFRKPYLLCVPGLALVAVIANSFIPGTHGVVSFLDWQLVFGRVDKLSTVFALIMALMAVLGTL